MSKKYSFEFKLKVVQEYLEGALGYALLVKNNISSKKLLQKWITININNPGKKTFKQRKRRKDTL